MDCITDKARMLANKHSKLFYFALKQLDWYMVKRGLQADQDDLNNTLENCFLSCCEHYEDGKGSFGNYFMLSAKRTVLGKFFKKRKLFPEKNLHKGDFVLDKVSVDYEKVSSLYKECLAFLDEEQREILKLRADGLSYREIGERFGCSHENIRLKLLFIKELNEKRFDKYKEIYQND